MTAVSASTLRETVAAAVYEAERLRRERTEREWAERMGFTPVAVRWKPWRRADAADRDKYLEYADAALRAMP